MKKLIAVVLVLLLSACTAAPAISPDAGETPPPPPSLARPDDFTDRPSDATATAPAIDDGTTVIDWLIPVLMNDKDYANTRQRLDVITDLLNTQLYPHELSVRIHLRNTTLTPKFKPDGKPLDDAYSVTADLLAILASGEEIDLISLPTAHVPVHRLADMGLLRNIAGELPAYPNLSGVLDAAQLDAVRYAGGIFGVPTGFDMQENLAESYLAVSDAPFVRLGNDKRDTLNDLLYAAKQAATFELPYTLFFSPQPDVYRREYPQFPFKVSEDFLFVYTADGGVEPYPGSQIAMQDLDLAKNIREGNGNQVPFDINRMLMYLPTDMRFEFVNLLSDVADEAEDYTPVLLAPGKPVVLRDNPYGKIYNAIPANAPAYGLVLLDLIYGHADMYNLMRDEGDLFGFSLEAFVSEYDSPATRVISNGDISSDGKDLPGYGNNYYYFSLFDCVRQATLESSADSPPYTEMINEAAYSPMPWDGFVFDYSPIADVYTGVCKTVWGGGANTVGVMKRTLSLPFLFHGTHTIEDLSTIGSNAYQAGLDVVLEECRRQYAAFLRNKGWIAPTP